MGNPQGHEQPKNLNEHRQPTKLYEKNSATGSEGKPTLPVAPGCQFSLAPAPPNMKYVHCVRDGLVASSYPVLFVGVIFPVGPEATIKEAKTYYLLELATAAFNGWFPIEHCFFDVADAQKEATRQRQEK